MYVSAVWAGGRLRSAVRLGLGSLLGADVVFAHILDRSGTSLSVYYAIGTALWLALGAFTIAVLVRRGFSRSAWTESIASLLLLVGVAITRFSLVGNLSGDVGVLCFIVFYLAELRGVVRTHPGWYAALAIAGTTVAASLTMAEVEEEAPDTTISDGGIALLWASSQLFRFGALVDARPVTGMGQFFGVLVILSGVLFSAVMLSAITAWVVRQGGQGTRERDEERYRQYVREALREAGLLPDTGAAEDVGTPRVFVNVEEVVGRVPRYWWRSRTSATREFLEGLPANPGLARYAPPTGQHRVYAVVQSGIVSPGEVDADPAPGLSVVVTTEETNRWIDGRVRERDAVVTGNAEHAARLSERGVALIAPSALASRDRHRTHTP